MPYAALVCPEHVRSIHFNEDWQAGVTVRRTLVFLEQPEPGDLHDVVPFAPNDQNGAIEESPDAYEIARVPCPRGTRIYWKPRESIVPYALYVHQYGWHSQSSPGQSALYTECCCEERTGILRLEVFTPVDIETAVMFKRPRWPWKRTERQLTKCALTEVKEQRERAPIISWDGQQAELTLIAPKIGEKYVCVIFTPQGVTRSQRWLEETSLRGRMRRLLGYVPGFAGRP